MLVLLTFKKNLFGRYYSKYIYRYILYIFFILILVFQNPPQTKSSLTTGVDTAGHAARVQKSKVLFTYSKKSKIRHISEVCHM